MVSRRFARRFLTAAPFVQPACLRQLFAGDQAGLLRCAGENRKQKLHTVVWRFAAADQQV